MSYPPGRELDKAVAIEVLDLHVEWDFNEENWCFIDKATKKPVPLPGFSTDTNHAYTIIHFLQTKGYYNNVGSTSGGSKPIWRSTFYKQDDPLAVQANGESLPHAVCLAALHLVQTQKTGKMVIQFPKTKVENDEGSDNDKGQVIEFPGKKKD
jgi:hypothetical protein